VAIDSDRGALDTGFADEHMRWTKGGDPAVQIVTATRLQRTPIIGGAYRPLGVVGNSSDRRFVPLGYTFEQAGELIAALDLGAIDVDERPCDRCALRRLELDRETVPPLGSGRSDSASDGALQVRHRGGGAAVNLLLRRARSLAGKDLLHPQRSDEANR